MQCLMYFSLLLEYPDTFLWQNKHAFKTELADNTELTLRQKECLCTFIDDYLMLDLLSAQAEYSLMFDLGSRLSLLLFEHIHGDSRERGPAMSDLIREYRLYGLELNANELPDHLPLVLEFLSQQPYELSQPWLTRIGPFFRLLSLRLGQQNSRYRQLFDLLFELSQCDWDDTRMKETIKSERDDRTFEALDAIWQEEQVLFSSQEVKKKRTRL